MAKQLLYTLIFTLAICCQPYTAKAQAIAGGEIYYELISPKKYKVTAHIYRMCDFQGLNTLFGTVYANSSLQVSFSFSRTSIQKISDTCNNPCKVQNSVSTAGFERHTWVATIDFNSPTYSAFISNNICTVNFAVRMSGRMGTVAQNPGLFYIDAQTNICDTTVKSNHSPVFSMEPKFLAPCGQPLFYSPGPLDSFDYDSLGFEIVPVQIDYNKSATYITGFTSTIPLTPYCPANPNVINCTPIPNALPPRGFYFDYASCQIVVTPTKCTDRTYIKMRVTEYRRNPVTQKMVALGFVTRDMLLQIKTVADNNPISLTAASSVLSICNGDILVTAKTKDPMASPLQTSPDTTTIFWDKGYKRSMFNIVDTSREKTMDITLRKDSSLTSAKRQIFTVGAYDRLCNISLISKSFVVTDYPFTAYKISKSMSSCNVWKYNVVNPDTIDPNNIKTTVRILDPAMKTVFNSINNSDSFTFNTNGRHIIEYTISNRPHACNKVVLDTVQISNAFIKGTLTPGNDTTVCSPYPVQIKFKPYKSPGMTQLQWYRNDTLYNSKDSVINLTLTSDARFVLKLTNNKGCLAESKVNYTIKQHNALLDFPTTECKYTLTTYTAIINTLKAPITYKWNFNGKDTSVNTRSLSFILTDTSYVKLTIRDANNCEFKDSLAAYVIPSFSYKLQKSRPEICPDSLLTLTVGNLTAVTPYKLLWKISKTDSVVDDTMVTRRFKGKTTVLVNITDANTCTRRDSFIIDPIQVPKPFLPTFTILCEGDLVEIKPPFQPNPYPKIFTWKLNNKVLSNTDSFYTFNIRQASVVYVKSTNKLGCSSEDSTMIQIHQRPSFNITGGVNFNRFKQVSLSTDKDFPAFQWFNNVFTRSNTFWAYELGTPGKHTIWCNVTDTNGCNGGDTIDIYTDKFTGVKDIDNRSIKIYPNPGTRELFIEVMENCALLISTAEGKQVMSGELHHGINTIDIESLPTGIYIITAGERRVMWLKE